ncbi:MAG: OadG family protein [Firmicutes bacterium]|nr:OadG family protein [Bacillota bacterium]
MISLETLQIGLDTTLVGMGMVFLVLITLAIITWLLSSIVDGSVSRKQDRNEAQQTTYFTAPPQAPPPVKPIEAPITVPVPVPVALPVPAPALIVKGVNAKTVAAIIGAVSIACEKPVDQLRFIAIRRAQTTANAWSSSSTADIIANRQAYL